MADVLTQLQELGFGEYEARAYQALLQHQPVSGYELAKVSGIPRANIYLVLQKLEQRGAVVRVEDGDSTLYQPVEPEEFLDAVAHRFEQTVHSARQTLKSLNQPASDVHVWHIQGYDNLLAHARAVVRGADDELLVALWPDEARMLAADFAAAEGREVKITTLCMAACAEECGGCRGRIFRNQVVDTQETRWLLLVPDEKSVLVGEVAGDWASTVRTHQRLLVQMTTWFIRHSIALALMLPEFGAQLETQLTSQARAALAAVGPEDGKDWLSYMRELLSVRGRSANLSSDSRV